MENLQQLAQGFPATAPGTTSAPRAFIKCSSKIKPKVKSWIILQNRGAFIQFYLRVFHIFHIIVFDESSLNKYYKEESHKIDE